MIRNTGNFDWEKFAFGEVDLDNTFDERILYREIRRSKLTQKSNLVTKKYQIYVRYHPSMNENYYITILNRYFGVKEEEITNVMAKLTNDGGIVSQSLSSSVADLLLAEISTYLSKNGFGKDMVSKEVSENAIKKPRSNLT
jgi:hypothetical protein